MKRIVLALFVSFLLITRLHAQQVSHIATLPIGGAVSSLQFPSNDTGYCIINTHAYRSLNGGVTWDPISQEQFGGAYFYRSMYAVTTQRIILGKNTGGNLLISNDGGTTWETKTVGINNMISSIHFIDPDKGFLVTSGNSGSAGQVHFIKTSDGGQTWSTPLALPGSGYDAQVVFLNEMKGFIFYQAKLYKTTDGGNTWTASAEVNDNIYTLSFIDANNGWAGGKSRYFLKTTDGGITWTTVQTTGTPSISHINKLHFTSASDAYMIEYSGQQRTIRQTSNGGASWDTIQTKINALDLFYGDPGNIWLFGANNNVYKLGSSTGIEAVRPKGINLYPNPSSGILYIEHGYPQPALLSVYNLVGEKMLSTVCENKTSLDISTLPAGSYILTDDTGMKKIFLKTSD